MKKAHLLLILFFIGQISFGQTVPYGNNPKAGKYINVGDAKLYYEIYGSGKPLLATPLDIYFPDWLMGYKAMSPADLALIEKHDNLDIKSYFKSSQPYKLIRLLSRSSWQQ